MKKFFFRIFKVRKAIRRCAKFRRTTTDRKPRRPRNSGRKRCTFCTRTGRSWKRNCASVQQRRQGPKRTVRGVVANPRCRSPDCRRYWISTWTRVRSPDGNPILDTTTAAAWTCTRPTRACKASGAFPAWATRSSRPAAATKTTGPAAMPSRRRRPTRSSRYRPSSPGNRPPGR